MRTFKFLTLLLCLGLFTPAYARNDAANNVAWRMPSPYNPAGLWITASGNAVVQIAPCGQDLCGQIVGLVLGPNEPMPRDWAGNPQCGLTIFHTAPPTNGNAAWTGTILDPRDGSQYDAQITIDQPDQLQLRGYIGLPIFGRTQTWTPYNGAIPADCRLQAQSGAS
jgi:uncharacterized protein (DUF2147 family)